MTSLNVAEAKKHFSELLARVAFGGESVLITRRGKPMAKLIPAEVAEEAHLDSVEGWLADDDPFFSTIDDIVASRSRHTPRVLQSRESREDACDSSDSGS